MNSRPPPTAGSTKRPSTTAATHARRRAAGLVSSQLAVRRFHAIGTVLPGTSARFVAAPSADVATTNVIAKTATVDLVTGGVRTRSKRVPRRDRRLGRDGCAGGIAPASADIVARRSKSRAEARSGVPPSGTSSWNPTFEFLGTPAMQSAENERGMLNINICIVDLGPEVVYGF